jgi:hypothetical protein
MPSSALTYCSARPPSSTPGPTPAPSHLPTPRNSSPPPIPLPLADSEASTMGRERRVRKSINYAEPKLNTCVSMRLPSVLVSDPPWPYLQKDAQTRSHDRSETGVVGARRQRARITLRHPHGHGAAAQVVAAVTRGRQRGERWRAGGRRAPRGIEGMAGPGERRHAAAERGSDCLAAISDRGRRGPTT